MPKPLPEFDTLFYLEIGLYPAFEERARAAELKIGEVSSFVDGIILNVLSRLDQPDAATHPMVLAIIDQCHRHDLEIIWGRDLWPRWRGIDAYSIGDLFNPAWYAAALSAIRAEADALDIERTFIYAEPHGEGPLANDHAEQMLHNEIDDASRIQIDNAIRNAQGSGVPPADIMYPAFASSQTAYPWALLRLGKLYWTMRTFGVGAPPDEPIINPPVGTFRPSTLNTWAVRLAPKGRPYGPNDTAGQHSVEQFMALDWAAIQVAYPKCKTLVLFAETRAVSEVMYELGKVAEAMP